MQALPTTLHIPFAPHPCWERLPISKGLSHPLKPQSNGVCSNWPQSLPSNSDFVREMLRRIQAQQPRGSQLFYKEVVLSEQLN